MPGHPFPRWQHAALSQDDVVLNGLARLIGVLTVVEQGGQPSSVGGLLPMLIGRYLAARRAAANLVLGFGQRRRLFVRAA